MPASPHAILAELLLLVAIPVLLSLGGAFALRRARGKKVRWLLAGVVVTLVFFFSFSNRGVASLVTLVAGAYAFISGLGMAWRGYRGLPAEMAATPGAPGRQRLVLGGLALMTAAVVLGLAGIAFSSWYPMHENVERDLRRFVAAQMHLGSEQAGEDGQPRYAPLGRTGGHWMELGGVAYGTLHTRIPDMGGPFDNHVASFSLEDDGRSFRIWVVPRRLPFAPFHRLVTLPSYYADQTGKLRKVDVHANGLRCPEDATVFAEIGEKDIADAAEELAAKGKETEDRR